MAEITTGVQIQGTLTPTYDEDNYPVTDSKYNLGGYHEVTVVSALTDPLDAEFIPLERQRKGMLAYAEDTDLIYKLVTPNAATPFYAVLSTGGTSGLNSNYQIGGTENTIQITATDGPVIFAQAGVDPGTNGIRFNDNMRLGLGTDLDDVIYYDSTADRMVIESATEIDLVPANDELLIGATAPTSGGRFKIKLANAAPAGSETGYGRGSMWIDMNVGKLYLNIGDTNSASWIVAGQQQA